jgi:hypothetical protein
MMMPFICSCRNKKYPSCPHLSTHPSTRKKLNPTHPAFGFTHGQKHFKVFYFELLKRESRTKRQTKSHQRRQPKSQP